MRGLGAASTRKAPLTVQLWGSSPPGRALPAARRRWPRTQSTPGAARQPRPGTQPGSPPASGSACTHREHTEGVRDSQEFHREYLPPQLRTTHPSRGSWENPPHEHQRGISDVGEPFLLWQEPAGIRKIPNSLTHSLSSSQGAQHGAASCFSRWEVWPPNLHSRQILLQPPPARAPCRQSLSPSTSTFPNFQRAGVHL